MSATTLQIIRPIPEGETGLRVVLRRMLRLAIVYLAIALTGVMTIFLISLFGWPESFRLLKGLAFGAFCGYLLSMITFPAVTSFDFGILRIFQSSSRLFLPLLAYGVLFSIIFWVATYTMWSRPFFWGAVIGAVVTILVAGGASLVRYRLRLRQEQGQVAVALPDVAPSASSSESVTITHTTTTITITRVDRTHKP